MSNVLQSDSTAIRAIESNLQACINSLATLPDAKVHLIGGSEAVISGRPVNFMNAVSGSQFKGKNLAQQVENAVAILSAHRIPFRWWITPSTSPANLGSLLESAGLKLQFEDVPGMAIDLQISPLDQPQLPECLTISRVANRQDLEVWATVLDEGYQHKQIEWQYWRDAFEHFGFSPKSPWQHFIAFHENNAAAVGSVFYRDNIAGLYLVVTRESFRRRGIADWLTRHLLWSAGKAGAGMVVLQASEMGFGLYQKLGFKWYCNLQRYDYDPG